MSFFHKSSRSRLSRARRLGFESLEERSLMAAVVSTTTTSATAGVFYRVTGLRDVTVASNRITYQVALTNQGTTTLQAGGSAPTKLAAYFSGKSDRVGDWTSEPVRFALANNVAPGQTIRVTVSMMAPAESGQVTLRHRLVTGQQWSTALTKNLLTVTRLESNIVSTATRQTTPGQPMQFSVSITNHSSITMRAAGSSRVQLAIYDQGRSDAVGDWSVAPRLVSLPSDIARGQTVTVPVAWTAPNTSGIYAIRYRLVAGDSWSPVVTSTPLVVGTPAAAYQFSGPQPTVAVRGQTVQFNVRVTNTGTFAWEAGANSMFKLGAFATLSTETNPYRIALPLSNQFQLPSRVAPGQSVVVPVRITLPDAAGLYTVRFRMMSTQSGWFATEITTNVRVHNSVGEIALRDVPNDLTIPALVDGPPAAGKRVLQKLPGYETWDVAHTLYLPTDWVPGKKYPVIVEYVGNGPTSDNFGNVSTGRVEDATLGYGASGGTGFILLSLPFVDPLTKQHTTSWWGDPDATAAYCREAIAKICADYGGDRDALILAGFSRGAIACNYIGLRDDEMASLWKGMICHSYYDGVVDWTVEGSDALARQRMARFAGKPQFISHEGSTEATRNFVAGSGINATFVTLPFSDHTADWVLKNLPERRLLREWLANVLAG